MITTGVSPLLQRPQTFHQFLYTYATRALIPLPLRVALVGTKSAAGTAIAGQVYEVSDPTLNDTLFGVSSELSIMCRKALQTAAFLGQGPALFAVALTEPGAGTADVRTLTATGTATADGTAVIQIAGRTFQIGIRNGDTAALVGAAIETTLKQYAENLPVVVTRAAGVVTLTAPQKGINGVAMPLVVVSSVPGVTLTPAVSAAGTGVADAQVALDALAPLPFDGVALANHAAADVTQINADIAVRWGYAEKRWRYYFMGEPGSIGTATALTSACNHQALLVNSIEGCPSLPGEMAAALAVGSFSRNRPNANYDGMRLPLTPPPAAMVYTPTEVETAIAAGLTPCTAFVNPFTRAVTDGVVKVERMITAKTTQAGNPFRVLQDLAVSRTGIYLAQQLDVAYGDRFSADANPDGTLLTDDTVDQVRDMCERLLRAAEDAKIIRNVDLDLARLVVERDLMTIGRINVDIPYTVVVGLHQIAFLHRVQV